MAGYRNVGPDGRDELPPQRSRHDMRRTGQKMADALRTPMGGMIVMIIAAFVSGAIPMVTDAALIVGLGFAAFIRSSQKAYSLPAKLPKHSGMMDPSELNPGTGKPMKAAGTFYLGNDRVTGEEVWLTNRDAGVHMLVLGTTGSGKTEMLLGLCQNALNQGSGFMFVDGKAQDKIAFKIQDLCRARGRDDDVLVLNFMTGARDIIGAQASKITHTMNPFSYGSSGMISQIVVGLMAGGGSGSDMWADRAISFVEAISPPLTYMRDNHGLILDVNEYRKFFDLERLEELAWKGQEKYPGVEQVLDPLRNYIINLPGYDKGKVGKRGGQSDDCRLQHGYITMQLVRAFTSLADTYGHIVRVPLGEVYFPDVVKQRRILIAMLPSLEKTPSETANIGKIIVTALRNIMAEGLGSILEGSRDDLDNDEGRSLLPPYVVILDEYGYYAVKGFAVAFAQARSLGFVCVVGGQDLASFQKESKEEAVSICGNTRLKAFGSIEDPEQTMDFAIKTGGKGMVAETGGFDGEMGMFSMGYSDNNNVHLKPNDRIDPTDVKAQKEGQFHFVFGAKVIRAQTYYVNPKKVNRVQLNHFIQIPPPDKLQQEEILMASSGLAQRMATSDLTILDAPNSKEIDAAALVLGQNLSLGVLEHGIAAIVSVSLQREKYMSSFREQVASDSAKLKSGQVEGSLSGADGASGEMDFDADKFFGSSLDDVDDDEIQLNVRSEPMPPQDRALVPVNHSGVESLLNTPVSATESVTSVSQVSVFAVQKQKGFGADVFASDAAMAKSVEAMVSADDAVPLLDFNQTIKGVAAIEKQLGATQEEAMAIARDVAKDINDVTKYPQTVPSEKTVEQVHGLLNEIMVSMDLLE